jgi:thiamine-phosphate diphosphorylase
VKRIDTDPVRADLAGRLRLMVILDPAAARGRTLEEVARLALRGGATALQLRLKQGTDAEALTAADGLRELARTAGALFMVNDRPDVAQLCRADGAHLGPQDLPVGEARRLLPAPCLIGASAGTPEEARRAEQEGADYLGAGPVFTTSSKPDAGSPLGPRGLEAIVSATLLPVISIGGIDVANAAACMEAGASGVAVISAVTGAASVAPAARLIRRAVDAALGARR